MNECSLLNTMAFILVVIGALNWAAVGLADFNVVSALFGPRTIPTRVIYTLVGLSGLYLIFYAKRLCSA